MVNYTGIPCPVCKEPFKTDDDIVVCPECGTPYHRDCYKKSGHCLFQDKHGNDKNNFTIEDNRPSHENDDLDHTLICPNCLARNSESSRICKKCGYTLLNNQTDPPRKLDEFGYSKLYPNTTPITFDPMGHVKSDEDFTGVTAKELASYIGVNTMYYLPTFKRIKDNSLTRFNFSAFLFSGGWFLYRKQYKIGIVITVLMFSLIIGSICIEMLYNAPIITAMLTAAGISPNTTYLFTSQNIQSLMQQIIPLSFFDKFMLFAPTAISFVEFIIMIICGFIGNKHYMNHCIKAITKLKTELTSATPLPELLVQKGGVNKALALSMIACYFIITYFLKFALI